MEMSFFKCVTSFGFSILLILSSGPVYAEPAYDVVIKGGRVIDPESGLDAVRNIGIKNDKILAISESSLQAANVIDANGRISARSCWNVRPGHDRGPWLL